MTKDKRLLYMISFLSLAVLFAALFIEISNSKILAACALIPISLITCLLIKKRRSLSINKKEVLILSSIISVIYVVLYQMTGIFFGFYKNPYFVNAERLLTTILPLTVIIVLTEIIRYVFLAQNNKIVNVITYISCVITEILMVSSLYGITSFNRFMDLVGLSLFPAISANVYYHYVSKRYGALPNIVFRLITTLYIYFIPNVTAMSNALHACIKICLPIVMLALTSALFEKKKKKAVQKGKKLSFCSMLLSVLIIGVASMLISCQFHFGALVIASDSMTGEINKGDVILFERYENQTIEEGQVIVFLQNGAKIVHRVVKIENIGGELRYYTKGDANEDIDSGYRTDTDIFALSDVKVSYVGYPTLLLRELLEGSN